MIVDNYSLFVGLNKNYCCYSLFQLHNHFDFGMVERIKMQFDEVNASRTGMITYEEFGLFLDSVLDDAVSGYCRC